MTRRMDGLRERMMADHDRLRVIAFDMPTLARRVAAGDPGAGTVLCEALRYLGALLSFHESCEAAVRDEAPKDSAGREVVETLLHEYGDEEAALSALDAMAIKSLATSRASGLIVAAERLALKIDADLRAEEDAVRGMLDGAVGARG